jgi:helicase associated protein
VPIQTSAVPVPDDVAHYSRDAIRKSRHANWTWVPFWQEHSKLIDGQTRAAGSGGGWKILRASDYYNGMKRKLFKTHKDRWEQGFAALSKFRRRKRHCLPSRHHLEGKFKLGEWVTTQRYLKDGLSVERKRRLDAIGFVWDWRNYRWEQGFAALLKFKHREGHCRVPIQYRQGNFRLGYWVSTQRKKRTELPDARKRQLKKIGFVWRERQGYRRAMEIKDAL